MSYEPPPSTLGKTIMNPIYYTTTDTSFWGLFFFWFFLMVIYEIRESIATVTNTRAKYDIQFKEELKYVYMAWIVAWGIALYHSVPGTVTFACRTLPILLVVRVLFWIIPKACDRHMAKKALKRQSFHP
jgi:hypothetical protein